VNSRVLTRTTLITGSTAAIREQQIANRIDVDLPSAVILEGLHSGAQAPLSLTPGPCLQIVRIAPGCLCCTGNLILRVTLNRLLRTHPQQLYIGLTSTDHLAAIHTFLSQPDYASWLTMEAL
jgi:hypothetical protein